MALLALDACFLFKFKQIGRVLSCLGLSLSFIHLVKKVREVLSCVLLLACLKVRMILPNEILKNLRADAVLVILIRLLRCW